MTMTVERPAAIRSDRLFFSGMAVATALTVFAAFAPTYYLRSHDLPALSPTLQIHGFIFTSWMLLFVAQTTLVATHRTDLHRRLGVLGAVLAAAVVVMGSAVGVDALRRGLGTAFGMDPRIFFAAPVAEVLCFAILASAGIAFRRHPEMHKRLMLLATISLVKPAIARFVEDQMTVYLLADIFVVAAVAYDLWSRGRIHPALVFGGLLIVIGKPLIFIVVR